MLNKPDLYTLEQYEPMQDASGTRFGTLHVKYEVRRVDDVRNLKQALGYRVICTHRVSVPNPTPVQAGPYSSGKYTNYPAMLGSAIKVNLPSADLELIDYSPRTLNASVQSSQSDVLSQTANQNASHTSGSSQSQSNTYGGSVSVGMFGASVDANYSHSSTSESSNSNTNGTDSGRTKEQSGSASVSIKDWGGYAQLDAQSISPSWVWAQEYPWDLLSWRQTDSTGALMLPSWVQNNLWRVDDGVYDIMPPSQLSLLGIDFTMKASWHIDLSRDATAQVITIAHSNSYVSASHGNLAVSDINVQINPAVDVSYTSPELDLTLLGLDPIAHGTQPVGTTIGFSPNKFLCPPTPTSSFKILAGDNTLQASGQGFDSTMQATCDAAGDVQMHLAFKITDDDFDYSLVLKSWKTTDAGSMLKIVVNGDESNAIFKLVDSAEGAGGERNLQEVALRNLDYTSVDYHDYLVYGLNTVDISITPAAGQKTSGIQLRAVAIEQN